MTLTQVNDATNVVYEAAGSDAEIIFGAVIDPLLKDEIRVTVIATGFGRKAKEVIDIDTNVVDLFHQKTMARKQVMKKAAVEEKREPVTARVDTRADADFDPDDLDVPTFLRKAMDN